MRHRKQGRKLGRTSSHRKALRRNLALSLFIHERITTTPAKAKEARRLAEKMITLAKDGSLHSRRRALSYLQDREVVDKLFDDIGPRFEDRNGGYTRILHLDTRRIGDSAGQVIFELVGPDDKPKAKPKAAKPKAAAKATPEDKPAEEKPAEPKASAPEPAKDSAEAKEQPESAEGDAEPKAKADDEKKDDDKKSE